MARSVRIVVCLACMGIVGMACYYYVTEVIPKKRRKSSAKEITKENNETEPEVDKEPTLSSKGSQDTSIINNDASIGNVDTFEESEINNVDVLSDNRETIVNGYQDKVALARQTISRAISRQTDIGTEVLNNDQQPASDEKQTEMPSESNLSDNNDTTSDREVPSNNSAIETYEFEDQVEISADISKIPDTLLSIEKTEPDSLHNSLEDKEEKSIVEDYEDMKSSDSGEGDSYTSDVVSDIPFENNQQNRVVTQQEDSGNIYANDSESIFITGSVTIDKDSVVEDDITETDNIKEESEDDQYTTVASLVIERRDTPEQISDQEEDSVDNLTKEEESIGFGQENLPSTKIDASVSQAVEKSSITSQESSLEPFDTNNDIENDENADESSSGSTSASSTVTSSFGVWDVNPVLPIGDDIVSSDKEEEKSSSEETKNKKRSRKRNKALRQSSDEKEE